MLFLGIRDEDDGVDGLDGRIRHLGGSTVMLLEPTICRDRGARGKNMLTRILSVEGSKVPFWFLEFVEG